MLLLSSGAALEHTCNIAAHGSVHVPDGRMWGQGAANVIIPDRSFLLPGADGSSILQSNVAVIVKSKKCEQIIEKNLKNPNTCLTSA